MYVNHGHCDNIDHKMVGFSDNFVINIVLKCILFMYCCRQYRCAYKRLWKFNRCFQCHDDMFIAQGDHVYKSRLIIVVMLLVKYDYLLYFDPIHLIIDLIKCIILTPCLMEDFTWITHAMCTINECIAFDKYNTTDR